MPSEVLYHGDPDYATPPGLLLSDILEQWNMTQLELAARLGLHKKTVNDIISGEAPILTETALNLERVLGVAANIWLEAENIYRIRKKKLEENIIQYKDILSLSPVKELRKRGYIPEYSTPEEGMENVLRFFGQISVDKLRESWKNPIASLRHSATIQGDPVALATWLRIGHLECINRQCSPYEEKSFKEVLNIFRGYTSAKPSFFIPAMIDKCAQCGVALAFIKEIKNAAVNGAACWLSPEKAMILVNLRGKMNDIFWFTFFHEAAHILHGRKKQHYVDYHTMVTGDPDEVKANDFASSFLIPKEYEASMKQLKSKENIISFARKLGIHPGIIIGRLQHDGIISYNKMNSLRTPFSWNE